jgi:transcriptional regulator with XRE-family HTH domain
MAKYFGEKFKQLRKSHDLTQEQAADIFHVSPQSVSRWETDVNYPDIEILPHIAGFFKVTVDELLGTEKILDESKVSGHIKNIRELLTLGKINDAIETVRKAVKEYPVNYDLQLQFLHALDASRTDEHKSEFIEVSERIINYCTNDYSCMQVKQMLFMKYLHWDMKDKAAEILGTLPSPNDWCSNTANATYLLQENEWKQNQQTLTGRYMYLLCQAINQYALLYKNAFKTDIEPLKKIEWLNKSRRIFEEIFEDEGDLIFNTYPYHSFADIAKLYCEAGDIENALLYVEKATHAAVYRCTVKWEGYKSSLHEGRYFAHEYEINTTTRNICWILWEDVFTNPKYNIIRNDERFIKCIELLKANSNERNEKIPRVS